MLSIMYSAFYWLYIYLDHIFVLTVFGSEKRSTQMPIQISTIVPAHNSLWVGTENGVLLTYPFTAPTLVAEETGWEFIKVLMHVQGLFQPGPIGRT